MIVLGTGAGAGAQNITGFDAPLFFGDYQTHTPDFFLVSVACSSEAGAQSGELLSLSAFGGAWCGLYSVPGSEVHKS